MAAKGRSPRTSKSLAYHDLEGGLVSRWPCRRWRPVLSLRRHFEHSGWAILDVTDPAKPEYLKFVPGPDAHRSGHAQDPGGGRPHDNRARRARCRSFTPPSGATPTSRESIIWDVKDPVNPKQLSEWHCGGIGGVHRFFYNGGRYCHLSATYDGFSGYIYVILDLVDPKQPGGGRQVVDSRPVDGRHQTPKARPPRRRATGHAGRAMMHGPAYPKGEYWLRELWRRRHGRARHVRHEGAATHRSAAHHPPLPASWRARAATPCCPSPSGLRGHHQRGRALPRLSNEEVVKSRQRSRLNILGMVDISDPDGPHPRLRLPLSGSARRLALQELQRDPRLWVSGRSARTTSTSPTTIRLLEDRNDRIYCATSTRVCGSTTSATPSFPKRSPTSYRRTRRSGPSTTQTGDAFPGPRMGTTEDVVGGQAGQHLRRHQHARAVRAALHGMTAPGRPRGEALEVGEQHLAPKGSRSTIRHIHDER